LALLNKLKLENAEFAFKANRKVPPSGDLGDHLIMPVQSTFVFQIYQPISQH
jgi:hypothetical protein